MLVDGWTTKFFGGGNNRPTFPLIAIPKENCVGLSPTVKKRIASFLVPGYSITLEPICFGFSVIFIFNGSLDWYGTLFSCSLQNESRRHSCSSFEAARREFFDEERSAIERMRSKDNRSKNKKFFCNEMDFCDTI